MTDEHLKIPNIRELLFPILKAIRYEHSALTEIRNNVAKENGIAPKDRQITVPPGSRNSFDSNFDVALGFLRDCGLITQERAPRPSRPSKTHAVVTLTSDGREAFQSKALPALPMALQECNLANEVSKRSRKNKQISGRAVRVGTASARSKPANILGAERTIIEGISKADLERLFSLWLQNVRRLGDPSQSFKHAAAKRIVEAVEKEWNQRLPHIRLYPDHFTWPSTDAAKGYGGFDIGDAPDLGMLAYLEYRVGRTQGQPIGVRRAILDRVVEGTLPLYGGLDFYEAWGEARTATRLQKLAEAIAAFTRNAKRRNSNRLSDAIAEWEEDLDYLHRKYYLPRFAFGWPGTGL